ncbi:MAG: hypothetical protein EOO12_05980 [Chitinophagaceae bacterium]|nr:MAG: hypothetical protein EOO12_05980 [Chitinophagaceae bacterium]
MGRLLSQRALLRAGRHGQAAALLECVGPRGLPPVQQRGDRHVATRRLHAAGHGGLHQHHQHQDGPRALLQHRRRAAFRSRHVDSERLPRHLLDRAEQRPGVELLSNGKLLFFTDHNILTFDPRRFTQSMAPPRPAITGITLQGANLPLDSLQAAGTLNLRYDRNALSFEFSGLSFTPQKKFHYYYMLEGLDKDWVHIENDNRAIYNYIPPGRYTFKVMSEDADGLTSEVALSVPVRVRPPVWQTWWFYALMILIAAFGLYLIDRERIRRLRALQQVRTQIAGNLHQEVETTLGDIHVLSEIAKIRAGTDLEQSKAFIDQISNKSRHMMEAMDDVLWSIDPANDGMQQMLMRIREFTDGITRNHTMDIDLIVDRKVEQLGMSMALRHELFFFYKESMQFLLQHVICDQVFINLKLKGPMLLLEIITSCEEDVPEFRSRYRQAVGPRVQAMKGLLEITMDHSNLSIVLRVVL